MLENAMNDSKIDILGLAEIKDVLMKKLLKEKVDTFYVTKIQLQVREE